MEKWIFAASMDVDPAHEELFNEIYEREHVPHLLAVRGVRAIARFRREDTVAISIGGKVRDLRFASEPRYSALYEIDSPEVLRSDEWAVAVERGRWAAEVRPFTSNRRHVLLRRISQG